MMVLASVYLSVSSSLPSTANIKPVEVWLLFNLAYPMIVILLNVLLQVRIIYTERLNNLFFSTWRKGTLDLGSENHKIYSRIIRKIILYVWLNVKSIIIMFFDYNSSVSKVKSVSYRPFTFNNDIDIYWWQNKSREGRDSVVGDRVRKGQLSIHYVVI